MADRIGDGLGGASLVTGVTGSVTPQTPSARSKANQLKTQSYFPNRLYEDRGMVCVTCGGCVTYT
jgi:hypothetical protein